MEIGSVAKYWQPTCIVAAKDGPVKLLRGQVFPVFSEMYTLHRDDENR